MHANLEDLFKNLWDQYSKLNPEVIKIAELLSQGEKQFQNDHVAFRTFNRPGFGIDTLAQEFLKLGYTAGDEYHFEKKKLFARHYEPPTIELPKVFISELLLEKCSPELQKIVDGVLATVDEDKKNSPQLCYSGRIWDPISFTEYEALYKESEYAAWLCTFGFCANHFTVFINTLEKFSEISDLNNFLKENGYALNCSGGEVKGTPADCLEQSSTMAHSVEVHFKDGVHQVPSVYYEFAKRYSTQEGSLYQGFVASSADKIFESTHRNN